jgi:hypothetical protein
MARKGKGGKKPTDDKKKVGESEPAAAPAASAEDADKSADQNDQDARVDEAQAAPATAESSGTTSVEAGKDAEENPSAGKSSTGDDAAVEKTQREAAQAEPTSEGLAPADVSTTDKGSQNGERTLRDDSECFIADYTKSDGVQVRFHYHLSWILPRSAGIPSTQNQAPHTRLQAPRA